MTLASFVPMPANGDSPSGRLLACELLAQVGDVRAFVLVWVNGCEDMHHVNLAMGYPERYEGRRLEPWIRGLIHGPAPGPGAGVAVVAMERG